MKEKENTIQKPMRRLFIYLKSYRKDLTIATLSSVINKVFDLLPPFLTAWLIDIVSKNPPAWVEKYIPNYDAWQQVLVVIYLTIFVFAMESFFEWSFKKHFLRLAQKVQHRIRLLAYGKMQSKELAYFEGERTGNLMAILNDDINQLERFLNHSLNEIIQLVVLFILASWSLFDLSPMLGLIGMLPIPLIIMASFYYQRKISLYYKDIRQSVGKLSSRLENNISGILVIKSFNTEKFEENRVEEVSQEYRDANFRAIKWSSIYVPIIRMLIALGFASTLAIGAYWVLYEPSKFTVGGLAFFAMMIQRLLWPVTRLGNVFDEFERAKASIARIFQLIDSPNSIEESSSSYNPVKVKGDIQLKSVSFGYNPNQNIINNLDIHIPQGTQLGIVGTTGVGKTTLIKLLLRLYDVNGGEILLDEVDIRDWNIEKLRSSYALVSQDTYLFHGSILDNLAYGNNANIQRIKEVAQQVELSEFIESLPEGYASIIGERGIKLSGGQRQRISIARAILKDAPILILDEATSSVDSKTERIIQRQIQLLSQGRTSIIIAHRLSTIQNADQIILLENGNILEAGKHEQLLAGDKKYAQLWKIQLGTI